MRNFFFKKIDLALILFVTVLLSCPFGAIAQGGYTLDFDGTDDYVSLPNESNFDFTTAMTVEAWIKVDVFDKGWQAIVTKGDAAWRMHRHTSTDNISFGTGGLTNTDLQGTTNVNDGKWHHVACVFDGSTKSLYVDGKLDASVAVTGTISTSNFAVDIGENSEATGRHFNGSIDEVRIWSDARTQAEIQANMHKELLGNEANLVAYHQMSDGTGTSLTDNSTNSNTGTLTNGPVWKTSGALAGPGMALDFDGVNDMVSIPAAGLNFSGTSLCIEAWIYPTAWATNYYDGTVVVKESLSTHGYMIRVGNSGQVNFEVGSGVTWYGATSNTGVLSLNEWQHLAGVIDNGAMTLYVNGKAVATGTLTGSFIGGTDPLTFGVDHNYPARRYTGKIDEVRIWSTARTEAQLRANKDRALDGDETGLEAYYRFDQQADAGNTTLYDQTANGYNGTLTNMTPATDWVASTPFNTWIGSEDSDWSNADNWSQGAVPSTEDVGVYAWSGSNSPASASITGKNIYVADGVSMSSTGNLTLTEDFYNAGTFTTTGNVTFSGSVAQTIRGTGTTTFGTFTVNNSKGVVLATDLGVSSVLALTSGVVNLGGQTLTLGSSASVSGSPAAGNHVNATSGIFRKSYSATGSFAFPVGDATLYSPITLNFTSGTFSSAYADVDLTVAKHPENISTGHYLSRYWTVSSSGISAFSCDVSATYVDGDITGTESELHGGKWDGSAWLDLGSATPASNLITGTVSGFSDFTGGQPYAFPVEWLNFSAKPAQDAVLLDWTTASEQNSDFFAIERSGNLEQWEELGTQAAAGNSSYQLDYQYEDQRPLAGTAWYRLRQVDLDGSFQYSATLAIHFAGAGIVVYPNPVKDKLTIEVPSGQQLSVELINLQGQQVWQQQITDGVQQLSLSELPSGLYTLRMRTEQNGETSYQIVKQ